MNCNIRGCPGHYEKRMIVHTVKRGCELLVFENVPADVCDVCSDTLLAPQTIRHLESIMRHPGKPTAQAPVFAYA